MRYSTPRFAAEKVKKHPVRRAVREAVDSFLEEALKLGARKTTELEIAARGAGLLRERQAIGASRTFQGAKKRLGIRSLRLGFGGAGGWAWELPGGAQVSALAADAAQPGALHARREAVPEREPPPQALSVELVAAALAADAAQPRVLHAGKDAVPEREPPPQALSVEPAAAAPSDPRGHILSSWSAGLERLHRSPQGIPPHRWSVFVSDCRRFMAAPLGGACDGVRVGCRRALLLFRAWARWAF